MSRTNKDKRSDGELYIEHLHGCHALLTRRVTDSCQDLVSIFYTCTTPTVLTYMYDSSLVIILRLITRPSQPQQLLSKGFRLHSNCFAHVHKRMIKT